MNNDLNNNVNNSSQNSNTNLFPDSNTLEQPVAHEVLFETETTQTPETPNPNPVQTPVPEPVPNNSNPQNNKTLIIAIILAMLLVAVTSGGSVYLLMKHNQNKTPQNTTTPSEEETEEPSIAPEEETITEAKVQEYLNYVPYEISGLKDAYSKSSTNISNYDKKILAAMAIKRYMSDQHMVDNNKDFDQFDNNTIKEYLLKMYNLDLDTITFESSTTKYFATVQGTCFYYNNGKFAASDCSKSNNLVKANTTYEEDKDDLIIYETVAKNNMNKELVDLYTNKTFALNGVKDTEYLESHASDFTSYKHTYKKSPNGYYWYSTEVVKNSSLENSNEEKPSSTINISNEELTNYLTYVPLFMIYDDVDYPFHVTRFDVNSVSKENLFDNALKGANESYWEEKTCNIVNNCLPKDLLSIDFNYRMEDNVYTYFQISNSNIDLLLRQKYNLTLKDMNFNLSNNNTYFNNVGKWCMISFDNAFLSSQCRGSNGRNVIYIIDDYKATNEELDIYSKIILTEIFDYDKDLFTGEDIVIDDSMDTKDYVLQNKDNFTEYKHTFKKNELGYYWSSTEVVE